MIATVAFACAIGHHVTLTGAAHSAPYVLVWNSLENLEEYDAGQWPSPSQILRRSVITENDVSAVVTRCAGRQIGVRVTAGRASGVVGYVNDDEIIG